MSIIDQNIGFRQSNLLVNRDKPIHPLKFAAALLFIFGDRFLYYSHQTMGYSENSLLNHLPTIVGLALGGIVAALPGQSKKAALIGIFLLLLATYFPFVTPGMNGWPVQLIFYCGNSMALGALLSRLLIHTVYMEPKQQTILLATTGTGYLFTLFGAAMGVFHFDRNGALVLGALFMIAIVICLLLDTETEHPTGSFSSFLETTPNFFTAFVLPFCLTGITASWLSIQCDRYYNSYFALFYGKNSLLIMFLMYSAALGLFALTMKQTRQLNYLIVLAIGGGLKLLIFLYCLTGPQPGDLDWIISSVNWIASTTLWFGFDLWIFRYTSFPGLGLLFAALYMMHHFGSILDSYVNIGYPPYEFYRF
ncbi:MAG TPA: hypothetical protein VD905_08345 [Flavobacteriales bacterium]|nr:hypothetical protein [Flavobacteriales bacterium]